MGLGLPGLSQPLRAEPGSSVHVLSPQDLVGQNEWLQEQLLKLLTSHSDTATAAQCALDLSLPEARLPATVAAELSRLRLQER